MRLLAWLALACLDVERRPAVALPAIALPAHRASAAMPCMLPPHAPSTPQLLCLDADEDEDAEALLGLIAANYPCKIDVEGTLDEHALHSGLAEGFGTTAKCG